MNAIVQSKLNQVFDDEQLDQFADVLVRVKERAIERHCDQEVSIGFTDKGHPRYIHATDNVKMRRPGYAPE